MSKAKQRHRLRVLLGAALTLSTHAALNGQESNQIGTARSATASRAMAPAQIAVPQSSSRMYAPVGRPGRIIKNQFAVPARGTIEIGPARLSSPGTPHDLGVVAAKHLTQSPATTSAPPTGSLQIQEVDQTGRIVNQFVDRNSATPAATPVISKNDLDAATNGESSTASNPENAAAGDPSSPFSPPVSQRRRTRGSTPSMSSREAVPLPQSGRAEALPEADVTPQQTDDSTTSANRAPETSSIQIFKPKMRILPAGETPPLVPRAQQSGTSIKLGGSGFIGGISDDGLKLPEPVVSVGGIGEPKKTIPLSGADLPLTKGKNEASTEPEPPLGTTEKTAVETEQMPEVQPLTKPGPEKQVPLAEEKKSELFSTPVVSHRFSDQEASGSPAANKQKLAEEPSADPAVEKDAAIAATPQPIRRVQAPAKILSAADDGQVAKSARRSADRGEHRSQLTIEPAEVSPRIATGRRQRSSSAGPPATRQVEPADKQASEAKIATIPSELKQVEERASLDKVADDKSRSAARKPALARRPAPNPPVVVRQAPAGAIAPRSTSSSSGNKNKTASANGIWNNGTASVETIRMAVGDPSTISLKSPISKLLVEDESICQAVMVGRDRLLVVGKQKGECRIATWTSSGSPPRLLTVVVGNQASKGELNRLSEQLAMILVATYPEERLRIDVASGGLVVKGIVSDESVARDALRIVRKACLKPVKDQIEVIDR